MKQPDAPLSIERYRRLAARYDASCERVMPIRRAAIALLQLQPGEVVLDVASGTGLSFPILMQVIGPQGHLIAVEHSQEMMLLARRRVASAGWRNVTLIEAAAEAADVPINFDAALFHYTHDVLQSHPALARLLARARPGARIAVAGAKFTSWWLAPLNLWVMVRARRYLTTYSGLRQPWRKLLAYVPDLRVDTRMLGTSYVAHGRQRSSSAAAPADALGV